MLHYKPTKAKLDRRAFSQSEELSSSDQRNIYKILLEDDHANRALLLCLVFFPALFLFFAVLFLDNMREEREGCYVVEIAVHDGSLLFLHQKKPSAFLSLLSL